MKNILGHVFGRLTVVEATGEKRWGVYTWRCRCECGKETVAAGNSLRSGLVRSCGCMRDEEARLKQLRHGMYGSPTYKTWDSMIQRCKNPKSTSFPRYGGVGITVCDRWLNFSDFLADMGPRPPGRTIDRLQNHLGYQPGNCRWATAQEQAHNKRKPVTSLEDGDKIRAFLAAGKSRKETAALVGVTVGVVVGVIHFGNLSRPSNAS